MKDRHVMSLMYENNELRCLYNFVMLIKRVTGKVPKTTNMEIAKYLNKYGMESSKYVFETSE